MLIRRLGRLCGGFVAALAFASASVADPISVVLDTHNLATLTPPLTSLTLYFQFTGVDGESVSITNFTTDGTLDDTSIVTTGSVGGSLASTLVLNGDSAAPIPSAEYFEPILLVDSIAFAFDVTSTNTGIGPLFAFLLVTDSLTALPPLDDNGQAIIGNPANGVLVQFDASSEPMVSLYSNDLVGVSNVPEPGALALLSIALVALGIARSRSRTFRLRG